DLVLCSDIDVETHSNGDENGKVATFSEISSPQHLQKLRPQDEQAQYIIINLLDWQICPCYLIILNVIPAENIVAAFQGSQKTVLAPLEQGGGGVVLKVEDVPAVLELKGYFDRSDEVRSKLCLTKVTISNSSSWNGWDPLPEGYFWFILNAWSKLHFKWAFSSQCRGKTCFLSELIAGKEVLVVDQTGLQ
ncbi:3-dehydroquinate synthase, partial [Dillenia turbinata]